MDFVRCHAWSAVRKTTPYVRGATIMLHFHWLIINSGAYILKHTKKYLRRDQNWKNEAVWRGTGVFYVALPKLTKTYLQNRFLNNLHTLCVFFYVCGGYYWYFLWMYIILNFNSLNIKCLAEVKLSDTFFIFIWWFCVNITKMFTIEVTALIYGTENTVK